jgi:hypothetical protein
MECPVCYAADAKLTTRCGHSFCFDCVKKWLVASNEGGKPSCPMCRTTLHFKGIHKIQHALEEERYERECSELFDECIQDTFENLQFSTELMPGLKWVFARSSVIILKDLEETMRVMKEIDYAHPEEIAEVFETGQVLRFKNEMRFMRRHEWKQRDKFAAKHERTRVKSSHR